MIPVSGIVGTRVCADEFNERGRRPRLYAQLHCSGRLEEEELCAVDKSDIVTPLSVFRILFAAPPAVFRSLPKMPLKLKPAILAAVFTAPEDAP
jgi:hypothetical protein